jgi:hypothetical protein
MRTLSLCLGPAMLLTACSNEPEYTDQQRACIAKYYTIYEAKRFDQCFKVCTACMRGNTVTCTTSCKLRGAI